MTANHSNNYPPDTGAMPCATVSTTTPTATATAAELLAKATVQANERLAAVLVYLKSQEVAR